MDRPRSVGIAWYEEVRDSGANLVSGASVAIVGTPIAPAVTNASGGYTFAAVPDGTYTATATPPGAPVCGCLCVSRKFEKLMPTRNLPFGVSSARACAEHSIMEFTW